MATDREDSEKERRGERLGILGCGQSDSNKKSKARRIMKRDRRKQSVVRERLIERDENSRDLGERKQVSAGMKR